MSAFRGAFDACERLLKAGGNVDAVDTSFGDNRTALHKAASEGHKDIVNLLIKNGADTSIVDRDNYSYLDLLEMADLRNRDAPSQTRALPTAEAIHNAVDMSGAKEVVGAEEGRLATDEIVDSSSSSGSSRNNNGSSSTVLPSATSSHRLCTVCGAEDIAFTRFGDVMLCQKCAKKKRSPF
jgi:ankyrin repeat protein